MHVILLLIAASLEALEQCHVWLVGMTCIVDPPTHLLNPNHRSYRSFILYKRNVRNKNKCKFFKNLPKKMKNGKEYQKH